MKNYIELYQIDLNTFTGVEGKIRRLIIDKLPCRKKQVGVIEQNKKYNSSQSSLRAEYAGYSKTYEIPIYDYFYNINTLIKFFKQTKTVMFRRKEVEIDSDKYIKLLQALLK